MASADGAPADLIVVGGLTTQRQCKAQLAEGCGSALRSQADDIDPPIDCKLTVTSIEPPRATAVMPLHSVDTLYRHKTDAVSVRNEHSDNMAKKLAGDLFPLTETSRPVRFMFEPQPDWVYKVDNLVNQSETVMQEKTSWQTI